jgi:hypothetical protein
VEPVEDEVAQSCVRLEEALEWEGDVVGTVSVEADGEGEESKGGGDGGEFTTVVTDLGEIKASSESVGVVSATKAGKSMAFIPLVVVSLFGVNPEELGCTSTTSSSGIGETWEEGASARGESLSELDAAATVAILRSEVCEATFLGTSEESLTLLSARDALELGPEDPADHKGENALGVSGKVWMFWDWLLPTIWGLSAVSSDSSSSLGVTVILYLLGSLVSRTTVIGLGIVPDPERDLLKPRLCVYKLDWLSPFNDCDDSDG